MKGERRVHAGAWLVAALLIGRAGALGAQQVTLPLAEWQKLWEQVNPPVASPPARLVVESAEVEVAVEGVVARVATRLTVLVVGNEPVRWKIPALGALTGVRSEGTAEAALTGTSAERWLVVAGRGRQRLTLSSVVPRVVDERAAEPTARLELALPAASSVTGRVRVPAEIQRVEAESGGVLGPDGDGWSFVGHPGETLRLTLARKAKQQQAPASLEPLVFSADTASALTVTRARRRVQAWLTVRVESGELSQLRLPVPAGHEVLRVISKPEASWELSSEEVVLTPLRPVEGEMLVTAELAADPAPSFGCPVLVPRGARSVRRAVRVAARSNDALLERGTGGRVELLESDLLAALPPAFRDELGEPLRWIDGEPSWSVTWATGGEVLTGQVDRLLVRALVAESGTIHYQLWAVVRSGDAAVRFGLPPGSRLLESRRDGVAVEVGDSGGEWALPTAVKPDGQTLFLEALVPGTFPVRGGRLEIPLPQLSLPTSQVEVWVAAPPGFAYELVEAARAGRVDPPPAGMGAFEPAPPGFVPTHARFSAWTRQLPPLALEVEPTTHRGGRR
jgi:hypothetical protein